MLLERFRTTRNRTTDNKLEFTSIPEAEWAQIEPAARVFYDEISATPREPS